MDEDDNYPTSEEQEDQSAEGAQKKKKKVPRKNGRSEEPFALALTLIALKFIPEIFLA